MRYLWFLPGLSAASGRCAPRSQRAAAPTGTPNVLLIVADDLDAILDGPL